MPTLLSFYGIARRQNYHHLPSEYRNVKTGTEESCSTAWGVRSWQAPVAAGTQSRQQRKSMKEVAGAIVAAKSRPQPHLP